MTNHSLLVDDQPVPLQNWCSFWLVDSGLWPHRLRREELGRRSGVLIFPQRKLDSGRLRAVVGDTLHVSWWMGSLMPLGEPGSPGHPWSSHWGDSEVRSILSKTLAITVICHLPVSTLTLSPQYELTQATAQWRWEHTRRWGWPLGNWRRGWSGGKWNDTGSHESMKVWKCESMNVGGGDSQAASGMTQVQCIWKYEGMKVWKLVERTVQKVAWHSQT